MTFVNRELADKYQDFFNFMSQEYNLTLTKEEMDEILSEAERLVKKLTIHDVCCGALEELDIRWMYLDDQTKCMPHIKNIQKDKDYRVNFCPVCGKNVRSVMIKP